MKLLNHNIEICPSMACNYNCSYCYSMPLWKYYINTPLPSIEKIDKILYTLPSDVNRGRIISILGGEPTLLPKSYIDEMCNMILGHKGVRSYIATNLFKPETLCDIPKDIGVTITCHQQLLDMDIIELQNKLAMLNSNVYLTYILLAQSDAQFAKVWNIYMQNTEFIDSIEVEFLHGKMEMDCVDNVIVYKNFLINHIKEIHEMFQQIRRTFGTSMYNPPPPISPHYDAESVDLLILTPDLKFTISSPNIYNIIELNEIPFFNAYEEAISFIHHELTHAKNNGVGCVECPYFFKCTSIHRDIPIPEYHRCKLYQVFTNIRYEDGIL